MNTQFYKDVAKNLLVLGELPNVARRYLSLAKRQDILQAGTKEMNDLVNREHPLAQINFAPPLSVAGRPSSVVVRAEGLLQNGIPIATALDSSGGHRGIPILEVVNELEIKTGQHWEEVSVLKSYREYMSMRLFAAHPSQRFNRMPMLINRTRVAMNYLEAQMEDHLLLTRAEKYVRFAAVVETNALQQVVQLLKGKQSVLVAFSNMKGFCVDGKAITTLGGQGVGCAVVAMSALKQVKRTAKVVGLHFGLTKWRAFSEINPDTAIPRWTRSFRYYRGEATGTGG